MREGNILSFVEVQKDSRREAEVICLSQDSSTTIVRGYKLDDQKSIPGRRKIFLYSTEFRLALGLT
jgi:hypothetical protein